MNLQKPQQYEATISEKKQLGSTIYHLRFALPSPQTLVFTPGQYATFLIDAQTRRQYSLCSDPHKTQEFEIVIDTTPMGPGSKFFLEKTVGDRVVCLAPLGTFGIAQTPMKKVLIATGTGIAPFRSMLRNEISNKKQNNPSISLYWGLRHDEDMYWDEEFKDLVGQLAGFQYFMCLSKPSEYWKGLTGHVTDYVFKQEKEWETTEFYLCGNRAMIEEVTQKLSAHNVKKEQIKTDLFY